MDVLFESLMTKKVLECFLIFMAVYTIIPLEIE